MIAKLSAWWAAWQWVVILLLVCLALAALNVWQWKRAITAPLRDENRELVRAIEQAAELAEGRNRDDAELITDLQAIAERGRTTRVIYREAAKAAPLPQQCAPGQARMDAVNQGLRGRNPEQRK
ncbi:MAG: hypothetical protein ACREO4_06275 [Lysobacter sp.]